MLEQNKCVPTKETHVNCTKGAPKNQKTESQRAKIELMKYNPSELRGTENEKEQSKINQIPNHQQTKKNSTNKYSKHASVKPRLMPAAHPRIESSSQ